jgi:hypothetical protein
MASPMTITQGLFTQARTLTKEDLAEQAILDKKTTSNWMFDFWSCTAAGAITILVNKLEKEAKVKKFITKKLTSDKKNHLKSLIKNCIHFEGKGINYTRGKQGKDTYVSSVELLHKLGLLDHNIANNEAVSSSYSFIYNYDVLLVSCSKVPPVKPLISTIKVKKSKDINGKKVEIKRADIPNPSKLRQLEKQMKDYNDLLEKYQINHPNVDVVKPMSYYRVFNGGSFRAEQGGRYYSKHPAHTISNKKDSNGDKPRQLITVIHTETQKQYQLVQYDYTAQHLNFLYLNSTGNIFSNEWSSGRSLDPYNLYEDTSPIQRKLTKLINMATLGSLKPKSVITECLKKEQRGSFCSDDSEYIEAMSVLDELGDNADETITKTIKDYNDLHNDILKQYNLGKEMPLALQYIDSCLATNIIQRFTNIDLPVWGWHDEFLIPCKDLTKDEANTLLTNICNEELLNLRGSKVLNRLNKLRK